MRRALVIVLSLALGLGLCLWPRNPRLTADEMARQQFAWRIVISGQSLGYLEPCGCAEGMLGGLPRRAAWVERLRENRPEPVVLLDNGEWSAGVDMLQEYKLRAFSKAFDMIGPHVARPGLHDLPVGTRALSAYAGTAMQLVSADLRCELWPAFIDIEVAGQALRITSLSDPRRALEYEAVLGAEGTLLDPAQALAGVVEDLPQGALLLVLFGGGQESARALFSDSRADLVVVAEEGDAQPFAERLETGCLLLGVGTKGRYLQELGYIADSGLVHTREIALGNSIPDQPQVRGVLQDFEAELVRDNLAQLLAARKTVTGGNFVGSSACKDCHQQAWQTWQSAKHAHGLETLEALGRDKNPECLACHTVGYGFETGFVARETTPDLAGIGCESCHGVGSEHVLDPTRTLGLAGEASCRTCHDALNSPRFNFREYWPKIAHGLDSSD